MPGQNNIMQMILQVKKQIGNGDPNVALQNFIEQNHIPQNMLDKAQSEAKEVMKLFK